MFRPIIHLALHIILPGIVARWLYTHQWLSAWVIMSLTMIVDLDHLLADPIYAPGRCSIGFHPLHSYLALVVYAVLAGISKTRLIGVGLLIHMALDGLDCLWIRLE